MLSRFHAVRAGFARNTEGVTAIEYGLIAGLIAVIIVGAITLVGTDVQGTFNSIAAALPL